MSGKIKVLFLAANSSQENYRRFQIEAREIGKRINVGKHRDSFELITVWAVRPGDLQQVLLEHQPDIVHFSGRGSQEAGVVLEDDNGKSGLVATGALADLFRILKDNIRVVLFNACYSEPQAQELARLIDYSIGLSGALDDEAAISFSAFFYQALVYARTVTDAFELARLELRIEDRPGFETPVLRVSPNVDIKAPFLSSKTKDLANQLPAIERYARLARQGLDPHILPRVSRRVVREKYLPAILRGIGEGRERIIPIIGPAGYGKSTILGDIYDELMKLNPGWTALVRCNDLSIDDSRSSVEQLSSALGEGASGTAQSVSEMARTLTAEFGAGVLLIDTLDLILNERLVPALRGALIRLIDSRTTVVFTCRDYEYAAFLEPTGERLAGMIESIDRYQVPQFARQEIEEATIGFIQNRHYLNLRERGHLFSKSILELSSDNRSLREIVSNPLLLAMLCDLFGAEGVVPDDLTVSKLYAEYWVEKIDKSRKYGPQSPVAIQKRKLCLDIARSIFELSSEHFQDSIYEIDLELTASEVVGLAYAELLSEGVIKTQPLGRIRFFHQTFLEYAIARWLGTRAGAEERERFLNFMRETDVGGGRLHWWPVVRQLLTIADPPEFDRLVQKSDLSNLATFRAVAYAAASRSEAAQISKLLPRAFELGDEYQEILGNAIELASEPLAESAWEVTIDLIARGKWRTAVKAAQTAGALVARRGRILAGRTLEALHAIEQRVPNVEISKDDKDSSASLVGWFLSAMLVAIENNVSSEVLHTLQDYYPFLSDANRAAVIRLHLAPGASVDQQRFLLKIVVGESASRQLKEELTTLLERLILNLTDSSDTTLGSTLFEALHAPLPSGWDKIQARAVGRHLRGNQFILEAIINDLFQGDQFRISRNQTAIIEAVQSGAAQAILASLVSIPVEIILPARIGVLVSIFQSLAVSTNPSEQDELVEWIKPLLQEYPDKLVAAFVRFCNDSPSFRHLLSRLLSKLERNQRAKIIRRIVRDTSGVTLSTVADELENQLLSDLPHIPSELALVELYGIRVEGSSEALAKLMKLSLGESERVARAASRNIVKAAGKIAESDAKSILALARSRITGVRNNCLEAWIGMVESGSAIDSQVIADVFAALENETQEPVLQSLCQLTTKWVRGSKQAPPAVTLAFEKFARRLLEDHIAGSGTIRALIITLKVIAQSEDPTLPLQVSDLARTILTSTNLERVRDGESETVDLLSAVARRDPNFLPSLVPDCATLPWRNSRAVVSAIKRVEGSGSHLLDDMFAADWCSTEVRSFILELRGL